LKDQSRIYDDSVLKNSKTHEYQQRMYTDSLPKHSHLMAHFGELPKRRNSPPVVKQHEKNSYDSEILSQRSQTLHQRKEEFLRDQASDTNNPYIREMMRQDVDRPLNIRDIKFIRKHPTVPLPSSTASHQLSDYQPRNVSTQLSSPRTQLAYGRSSNTAQSYARPTSLSTIASYKPSIKSNSSTSHYIPYNNTASNIRTKAHTISPASYGSSYTSRSRPVTSFSDPSTSTTAATNRISTRPQRFTPKKSSGTSRDACVIS
jgi:hypothetical protein